MLIKYRFHFELLQHIWQLSTFMFYLFHFCHLATRLMFIIRIKKHCEALSATRLLKFNFTFCWENACGAGRVWQTKKETCTQFSPARWSITLDTTNRPNEGINGLLICSKIWAAWSIIHGIMALPSAADTDTNFCRLLSTTLRKIKIKK